MEQSAAGGGARGNLPPKARGMEGGRLHVEAQFRERGAALWACGAAGNLPPGMLGGVDGGCLAAGRVRGRQAAESAGESALRQAGCRRGRWVGAWRGDLCSGGWKNTPRRGEMLPRLESDGSEDIA